MSIPSIVDVTLVIPLIILFLTSILPLTIKIINQNTEQKFGFTTVQSVLGILLSLYFWIYAGSGSSGFSEKIIIDNLAYISVIFVFIITVATLIISNKSLDVLGNKFSEHVFLLINASLGIIVVLVSNDLIVSFIGIELMSLSFYVLVGLSKEEKLSTEASIKYFVIGSVGSAVLLYGIAFLYGATSSFLISDLGANIKLTGEDLVFLIGILFVTVGLLFKASVFPFHAWVPDVYQGAPTPVTAYMSTAGKFVAIVFLIKIFNSNLLTQTPEFVNLLQWLSVFTMLYGNVCALKQESLKRMLAYSSIAHSGYVMIGIICLGFPSTNYSPIILFYLVSYAVMNLGAFSFVNLLEKRSGEVILLSDLKNQNPLLAAALTICLLSLAGLPPTMGFFAKFYLFSAAVNSGLFWLVIWAVISTMISIYYYLRPVLLMFSNVEGKSEPKKDFGSASILLACAILILVGGVFSEKLLSVFVSYLSF